MAGLVRRAAVAALILAGLGLAAPAGALTPEEVVKLKQAGVSDATIQKMLEQERQGGATHNGPITETNDQVIYRAGQGSAEDAQRMERHERRKERQSMEMLRGGIIVDQRGGQPGGGAPPTGQ